MWCRLAALAIAAAGLASPTAWASAVGAAAPFDLATLKAGEWRELPDTQIRQVLPRPLPRGNPRSITGAWSGGTVDTKRSRLLITGGGHADYWGNEVYALDLRTQTMGRVTGPSAYANQATCDPALQDGSPTSRHTYGGVAYVAHADQMLLVSGSLSPCGHAGRDTWTYALETGRWELRKASPARGFGVMAAYDAATRSVFIKDQWDFYAYEAADDRYTKLNRQHQYVDYHCSAAIDSKRRQFVIIGNGVQVIDLATNEMRDVQTQDPPDFVTGKGSPGVAYDPAADRIVAWHGGSHVYALDMDTLTWSQVARTPGPAVPAAARGTFGRWAYVPQYGVFVLVNHIDQNAWVFKLSP